MPGKNIINLQTLSADKVFHSVTVICVRVFPLSTSMGVLG